MEAQFVSWMSLSPTLEPIKGVYAWSTSKAKSSQDACLPSVSPSHFKQIRKYHNQGSSIPILKHPKWTKKKQVAQLCLTQHLVCNIMVKLKFCLFISCFYVSLNSKDPCSIWCTLVMYILKKKFKKISRFPNLSKKKEKKIFKWKKSLWTRGIEPLSHFLKRKKKSLN